MSLAALISGIVGIVHGIEPDTAQTYRYRRHQPQSRSPIDSATVPRVFDVVVDGAPVASDRTHDGTVDHLVHRLAVVVVYPLAAVRSRDELASMIAEDVTALLGALRPPSAWSSFASELYIEDRGIVREESIGTDGQPVSYLISIPLTVHLEV